MKYTDVKGINKMKLTDEHKVSINLSWCKASVFLQLLALTLITLKLLDEITLSWVWIVIIALLGT